ncbi:MAG: rhomboid family intramembrane serine protease [Pseudomonadota bacterium]
MFVPLHDDNSLKAIPFQYVTVFLIAANVGIFLAQASAMNLNAVISFALVPVEFLRASLGGPGTIVPPVGGIPVPETLTTISYMFFHGDWLHLLGNMMFLWVFGDNVEDAMGHLRFAVFYIACGVAAGLFHVFILNDSVRPLVGASGAVAGVIAAYLMLHPRVRVWVLAMKFIPLQINAAIALGLWVAIQIFMVLTPQVGPVAWWAHIGGLIAGAVLIVLFKRSDVPLFDRGLKIS